MWEVLRILIGYADLIVLPWFDRLDRIALGGI